MSLRTGYCGNTGQSPLWHVELIKEELVVWDALLLKGQHCPVRKRACMCAAILPHVTHSRDEAHICASKHIRNTGMQAAFVLYRVLQ